MQTIGVTVAVLINAGGAVMSVQQLQAMPGATVIRAEVTRLRRSACAAVVVKYVGSREQWLAQVGRWASSRGWTVAVAPRVRPD